MYQRGKAVNTLLMNALAHWLCTRLAYALLYSTRLHPGADVLSCGTGHAAKPSVGLFGIIDFFGLKSYVSTISPKVKPTPCSLGVLSLMKLCVLLQHQQGMLLGIIAAVALGHTPVQWLCLQAAGCKECDWPSLKLDGVSCFEFVSNPYCRFDGSLILAWLNLFEWFCACNTAIS